MLTQTVWLWKSEIQNTIFFNTDICMTNNPLIFHFHIPFLKILSHGAQFFFRILGARFLFNNVANPNLHFCYPTNIFVNIWGGGVGCNPNFCPWKKSIWKERETNTFPSLSIYTYFSSPYGKRHIFTMGKNGAGPLPIFRKICNIFFKVKNVI